MGSVGLVDNKVFMLNFNAIQENFKIRISYKHIALKSRWLKIDFLFGKNYSYKL